MPAFDAAETLGSPIALLIRNRDWANWQHTMSVEADPPESAGGARRSAVTRPRPGHADLAGGLKYGHTDLRDVLERASARETAARVAAGGIARALLRRYGIAVTSHVTAIGGAGIADPLAVSFAQASALPPDDDLRCADPVVGEAMKRAIDAAREAGDTVGGAFEVIAHGVPPGLGSYVQWDRKLDGRLAQALMSIPAIKAVGIGRAAAVSGLPGSRVHDEIVPATDNSLGAVPGLSRPTNNAGGLEGGVTNGEDVRVTAWMKPISTLMKPLRSVDLTHDDRSGGGDRAKRRLRRTRRRGRRRSDGESGAGRCGAREIRRRQHRRDRRVLGTLSDRVGRATLAPRGACLMLRPIVRYGESGLQKPAAPVTTFDDDLQKLIDDMIETMYAAPGIGLAAPQIGVPLRVAVVDLSLGKRGGELFTLVNPEFVERDGMQLEEEGCLSVPGFNATVARPARVVVRALDRDGNPQTVEGTDLLARALQHELDHLDGVLFLDRLRGIKRDLIVRRIRKMQRAGRW